LKTNMHMVIMACTIAWKGQAKIRNQQETSRININ
jgi:hypothetical protein